ncbi:PF20097 family protein [Aquisphaera insulae]|uniref:PF20097 family protein n=1 Tax=Aquisphaera insulae TaxID=2712864 RepID=UPI0034E1B427
MKTPKCPKCSQPMEEGFILDQAHNFQSAEKWVEGPPQWSFWTGLKLNGRKKRQVATYCCPKCGFLESYATMED